MRLIERTAPSTPLAPFAGLAEDERVLHNWDIVLEHGSSRSVFKWPLATSGGGLTRSRLLNFIRSAQLHQKVREPSQAPLSAVWQHRAAHLRSWPTDNIPQRRPADVPPQRWEAADMLSRGSETPADSTSARILLIHTDDDDSDRLTQLIPGPPPGKRILTSLSATVNGEIDFAHRDLANLGAPVT